MNFIKSIFCRKTQPDQPSQEDTFQDTQDSENNSTTKNMLEATEEIKNEQKTNLQYKRIALHALKKKKRYEKQLRDIDSTLSTLAVQRDELQNFDAMEPPVISALSASFDALEEILKNINIEMADESALERELQQLGDKELDTFMEVQENIMMSTRSSEIDLTPINS